MIIEKKITFSVSEKEKFALDLVKEVLGDIVETFENYYDDFSVPLYSYASTAYDALCNFRDCIDEEPFIEF